jgi:hypothetical protein
MNPFFERMMRNAAFVLFYLSIFAFFLSLINSFFSNSLSNTISIGINSSWLFFLVAALLFRLDKWLEGRQ